MGEDVVRENLVKNIKNGNLKNLLKFNEKTAIRQTIKPPTCEIDVCFKTTNSKIVGIEVKDEEVGLNMIMKGIGQALGYLNYCHSSYVAIPNEYKDSVKNIIERIPIGLITYSGRNFELIKDAEVNKPIDDFLINNFDDPSKIWFSVEKDNFLENIFNKSKEMGGKHSDRGKYRRILFLHSLMNLMIPNPKEFKIFEDLDYNSLGKSEKEIEKFVKKFEEKWYSFNDIKKESENICNKYKQRYRKIHSRSSLEYSRGELIPIGIVETKINGDKLLYRINPVFMQRLHKLLNEWETSK